ncbi:PKD domain-containing protein [Planococcus sp. APC 4015]|nr:PKD domain-containing protein [Planococcus sp. APC 4015]
MEIHDHARSARGQGIAVRLRRGSEKTVRANAAPSERGRRWAASGIAVLLAVGLVGAVAPTARADTAPAAGVEETMSADVLPTAQIDGVVWTQAVTGTTVWVGGEFARARPAGAAPGTSTVPRPNLMAYDIRTGVMTAWNPGANGVIKGITPSPDGSRIYVVGGFTTIAGQSRSRIAAFDTATGALLPWAPAANYTVSDVAAHGNTVFFVGGFTGLAGGTRTRLGAVNATTGALLPLSASLSGGYGVNAIVVDPTGSKIVVAGSFESANGSTNPGRGMAALSASTGASMPWAVNALIRNAGTKAAMTALTSDGDSVYGTGYDFGGGPEDDFEGTFRARWSDGALVWLEDCHGDNYSVAASSGVVYTASHDHYCGNVGGFPQSVPSWSFRHTLAFAKDYDGLVLTPDIYGYKSYTGRPAPTTLHWYPNWQVGTYTGKSQATWDVETTEDYLLYGGEFPQVNGVAQQGLARFAKKTIAPNRSGPERSGADFSVHPVSVRAGQVRLTWTANTDRDNQSLTYQIQRQDRGATPVCSVTADSNFWTMPQHACVDAAAVAGATHQYRVRAVDPFGNESLGAWSAITVATGDRGSAYSRTVVDDGAVHYWPLAESSGTTAADTVGGRPLTIRDATRGVAGPSSNLPTATQFGGTSSSYGSMAASESGKNAFTVEAWVKTTSTRGGRIVGFGNLPTGNSTMHDRVLYLSNAGRISFGVNQSGYRTLSSGAGFNDGRWHHVVGTLTPAGMALYVDGTRIGTRADTTSGQNYSGFWRVGGDNPGGWPEAGTSGYLSGAISDVAVYGTGLSAAQVLTHFQRASTSPAVNSPPVAAFTSQASGLSVAVDGGPSTDPDGSVTAWSWTFGDGGVATGRTATRVYASPGTYTVTLTVTDDDGATHQRSAPVTVTSPPVGGAAAQDAFERSVTGGWGSADAGGAWSVSPTPTPFSVASGSGVMRLASSTSLQASLLGISQTSGTVATTFSVDKIAHAQYISVIGRQVGSEQYLLRVRVASDGTLQLHVMRNGTAIGAGFAVPGTTIAPGSAVRVAFQVAGTAPTTLNAKIWSAAAVEPAAWQMTRTDATAAMQAPGSIGLSSYVPAAAGAYPVALSFLDFSLTTP